MGGNQPWKFLDHYFDHANNRLLLQLDIGDSNWANLIVETPDQTTETYWWKSQLCEYLRNGKPDAPELGRKILLDVLQLCRRRYRNSLPQFGNSLFIRDQHGQPCLVEELDPQLDRVLPTVPELFGDQQPPSALQLISRADLVAITPQMGFFFAHTWPVRYGGETWVAKGPASAKSAVNDLREAVHLFSLPLRRLYILPPPTALIRVSNEDSRICGFLIPFYENGNIDRYAHKLREEGRLPPSTLYMWFKQLVSACKFLLDVDFWHGDIKPDNILISESGSIVLIDLSHKSTTMAIASPEVLEEIRRTGLVEIPAHWPLHQIEKSEVYSIGRTMFFISEGISMMDVYNRKGPDGGQFPTEFQKDSPTAPELRNVILDCVQIDPINRPTLQELSSLLDNISGK